MSYRIKERLICWAVTVLMFATSAPAEQDLQSKTEELFRINDVKCCCIFKIEPTKGITHFGLDSEGQGRSETNLLFKPISIVWDGYSAEKSSWAKVADNKFESKILSSDEKISVKWTVSGDSNEFLWQIENTGIKSINNLKIEIPINPLEAAAVLIPAGLDKSNRGLGPWLLVAPDFGHLLITAESAVSMALSVGFAGGRS